jgi:hypothetical protein
MTLRTAPPALSLDETRARFRAFGLRERVAGTSVLYAPPGGPAEALFLVLNGSGTGAQIYLYPDTLHRPPGWAQPFYRTLDEAGFGMGSKLGPSITLEPADPERMAFFWAAFAALMGED